MKIRLLAIVAAMVFIAGGVITILPEQSYASIWNAFRTGYFDGESDPAGNTNCQAWGRTDGALDCFVIPDGVHVDAGCSNNTESRADCVRSFMNIVKSNYNSADFARKTGGAYIALSMLGYKQGTVSRNVSDDQFDELEQNLNNPNISINWQEGGYSTNNDGGMSAQPGHNPDVYIASGVHQSGDAIVIRNSSNAIIYALFIECGNPDGNHTGPIPHYTSWKISRSSVVTDITGTSSTSTAKVGSTVTWKHTVKNTGSNATNAPFITHYQNRISTSPSSAAWNDPGTEGPNTTVGSGFASGDSRSYNSTYTIAPGDVGRTLCRSTSTLPSASDNGNWGESNADCVTVPYDFTLNPTTNTLGGIVDPGATIATITPSINNTGSTPTNGPSDWQLTEIIVPPTGTITNAAQTSTSTPCVTFGNNCMVKQSGSQTFPTGTTPLSALSGVVVPPGTAIGSKICFALSVKPYKVGSTDWRLSAPTCVTVAKKPKVQVLGGDLIIKNIPASGSTPSSVSNIVTSTSSSSSGVIYGSWAEYGIIATGTINGLASGAGYAGGTTANFCGLSLLSFANSNGTSCDPTAVGKYLYTAPAPSIASRFPIVTSGANITPNVPDANNVNLLSLSSGVYTTASSTLKITSGTNIPAKHWVVINAPSTTVTIAANISYTTGSLAHITDIPQVVIIAKNIIIADSVGQVDSWLVASGTGSNGIINTCAIGASYDTSTTATQPNATQCNKQLTVNGPILANHLVLRRTANADTESTLGSPAEVFNLRADAYLWASAYSPGTGRIPTVDTKELPPRY